MLIREKKPEPKQENPYDWPKSYYMELDPAARKALLLQQDPEENALLLELWKYRYHKNERTGEYADQFMRALLELQFIHRNLGSPFSRRKNEQQALLTADHLALTRYDHYGNDLLYREMRHLVATYIMRCMEDRNYCSVLLNFGKMKEEKIKEKLYRDVTQMILEVPEKLEYQSVFRILTKAGMEALEQMGLAPLS